MCHMTYPGYISLWNIGVKASSDAYVNDLYQMCKYSHKYRYGSYRYHCTYGNG